MLKTYPIFVFYSKSLLENSLKNRFENVNFLLKNQCLSTINLLVLKISNIQSNLHKKSL